MTSFTSLAEKEISTGLTLTKPNFTYREGTTDRSVYRQIYTKHGLEFDHEIDPSLILDLGAYTGISTRWFCDTFPNAVVVGIEPCVEACCLASEHAPEATVYPVAVGPVSGRATLYCQDFGEWAFTTAVETEQIVETKVPQVTIDGILQGNTADIIKFDIEGAEKAIFEMGGDWLQTVKVLLVETHDRYVSGSCDAVMSAIRNTGRPWNKVSRGRNRERREEFAVVFDL